LRLDTNGRQRRVQEQRCEERVVALLHRLWRVFRENGVDVEIAQGFCTYMHELWYTIDEEGSQLLTLVLLQRFFRTALLEELVAYLAHGFSDLQGDLRILCVSVFINGVVFVGVVCLGFGGLFERGIVRGEFAAVCNDDGGCRDVA
jgi:hypothetical protein